MDCLPKNRAPYEIISRPLTDAHLGMGCNSWFTKYAFSSCVSGAIRVTLWYSILETDFCGTRSRNDSVLSDCIISIGFFISYSLNARDTFWDPAYPKGRSN